MPRHQHWLSLPESLAGPYSDTEAIKHQLSSEKSAKDEAQVCKESGFDCLFHTRIDRCKITIDISTVLL